MKPLELTCTLRNNRLKERRLALELTQREMSDMVSIHQAYYSSLETMRRGPKTRRGEWSAVATRLAAFYRTTEEDLFPNVVLAVRNPEVRRKLDESDVQAILSSHQEQILYLTPEDEVACREECRLLLAHEENTEHSCPDLVRRAFGLDEREEETVSEIAQHSGCSAGNVSQKVKRSIRRMRDTADRLRTR